MSHKELEIASVVEKLLAEENAAPGGIYYVDAPPIDGAATPIDIVEALSANGFEPTGDTRRGSGCHVKRVRPRSPEAKGAQIDARLAGIAPGWSAPKRRPEIQAVLDRFANTDGGALTLLNCTIIPPQAEEGEFVVLDVTREEAAEIVRWASVAAGEGHAEFRSAIGHEASAVAFHLATGQGWADRTPWDGTGYGLALQLKGRPQEGSILTLDQMEAMGYSFRLIYRGGTRVSKRVRDLEDFVTTVKTAGEKGRTTVRDLEERLALVPDVLTAMRGYLEFYAQRVAMAPLSEVSPQENEAWRRYEGLLGRVAGKDRQSFAPGHSVIGRATPEGIAAGIARSEERRQAGDKIGEVRVSQMLETGQINQAEAERLRTVIASRKAEASRKMDGLAGKTSPTSNL